MAAHPAPRDGGMSHQYLIFSLAGESFAVGTLRVREIIEVGPLTTVPMVPAFIRGVINLRGAVVPVIDLNARFGRGRTEVTRRTCIVILEVQAGEDERHVLGILVDAVSAVKRLDAKDVEPPPDFGTRLRADFLEGMARVNDRFVMLLDLGRVLSVDEIAMLGGLANADADAAAA